MFPRVHFMMTSITPVPHKNIKTPANFTVAELTQQMFDSRNMMCSVDPRNGKFFTASCTFRGRVSNKEVDDQLLQTQNLNSKFFCDWIPNNIVTTMCDVPPSSTNTSSSLIANSSSVKHVFTTMRNKFNAMFRRKAYLHWYTTEGMDEMEFTEAESNGNNLISEYQQYEDAQTEHSDNEEAEE